MVYYLKESKKWQKQKKIKCLYGHNIMFEVNSVPAIYNVLKKSQFFQSFQKPLRFFPLYKSKIVGFVCLINFLFTMVNAHTFCTKTKIFLFEFKL